MDQTYKNKHFPPSSFPQSKPPNAQSLPLSTPTAPGPSQSPAGSHLSELISFFADARIISAPPIIAGDIPPPCPIVSLPSELLSEIIDSVASTDVANLPRLALVCKRLAYLIASYEGLWKRLVYGTKYGLAGMHYSFAVTLDWIPILPESSDVLPAQLSTLSLNQAPSPFLSLPLTPNFSSYQSMFRLRPRVRFNGLYIATANYTRPGAASTNTITWSSPVHIVTYYRYLRFYRDGSCISLLTTTEPADVVPFFSREALEKKEEKLGSQAGLTTTTATAGGSGSGGGGASIIRDIRKGRWKLSPLHLPTLSKPPSAIEKLPPGSSSPGLPKVPSQPPGPEPDTPQTPPQEPEGNLTLETEGPTKNYAHHLHLALRSTASTSAGSHAGAGPGGAAANTKLVWRSFWSYNRLTDDWAEFGLRNDRPFWWSRVRSWGDA